VNTILLQDTTDPVIKKLFHDKLFRRPFHESFVSQEEGMERIRHGLHAFYGDAASYKVVSDSYEEDEKCRMKELHISAGISLGIPVKKGTPYREHLTQK
jgi:hypothetical protein